MRLLAKYLRAIPTDVRAYFRPFLYGLFGGLAAVGFQAGYASATIREAVAKMVDKSASLLVVLSTDETPIGIVTLHDVVRLQSQVTDAI